MPHTESDSDFNFIINSVSDFDSAFEYDSEYESSSVLINLDIFIIFNQKRNVFSAIFKVLYVLINLR